MDFKIATNVSLHYIYVSADEMRKDRIVETDHWSEQVKISVMVGDKQTPTHPSIGNEKNAM
jgi:hypothetical protein